MNKSAGLLTILSIYASLSFSQTELTIKKFRFQNHSSAAFERLVLEFDGDSVNEFPEVKISEIDGKKEAQITIRNVQLVGAIPENLINDSYRGHSRATGPISIIPDMPQNGFSLRTLIKRTNHQLDAFWLANPNRLVVDVFPPYSSRASTRDVLSAARSLASVEFGKKIKQPHREKVSSSHSPIFCFPASAQMSAEVAFQPWRGVNTVPLAVRDPASVESEMKEGIVCYPAQSRLYPNLTFSMSGVQTGGTPTETMAPAVMGSKAPSPSTASPAPAIPAATAPISPKAGVGSSLLPPLQRDNRSLASQPGQGVPSRGGLPPSLGASFGQNRGANPTSLLPPLR